MHEVTGSSPVSPTTSHSASIARRAGRTPPGRRPESRGHRLQARTDPTGDGTTRERPANRPGIRPLARHESARRHHVRGEGGWNRGRSNLSSCRDERFCDFSGANAWQTDRTSRTSRTTDEPEFDAPDRGSADELLDAGAHAPIDAMRHSDGPRHGRGRPRPVPGRQAGHRPRHRQTASTTTSTCRGR